MDTRSVVEHRWSIGAVIFCTASLAYDHPHSRLPKYKNTLPKYTVFLSDTKVNHSTATSEWHFKWHAGKVRIVGRGTPHPGHNEGVALCLKVVRVTPGHPRPQGIYTSKLLLCWDVMGGARQGKCGAMWYEMIKYWK